MNIRFPLNGSVGRGLLAGWFLCCAGIAVQAEPGKAFDKIRAKLVAQYDANEDGRLDAAERETMRLAAKRGSEGNGGRRGRRGRWSPPAGWLERYDRNKDGELDRGEQSVAFAGEQDRIRQAFDTDGDGSLNAAEKGKLKEALDRGEFEGVDRFIAMQVGGFEDPRRRGRGGRGGSGNEWLKFDRDGDGLASREELEAIRAAKAER